MADVKTMAGHTDSVKLTRGLLIEQCPICGREFSCNKSYHVYTCLKGRKRLYFCSYTCFKKRLN